MLPISAIPLVSFAYLSAAGFYHWPLWHIIFGAVLLAGFGTSRAFLAANGPISVLVFSYGQALRRGFEQRLYEWGWSQIVLLIAGQIVVGGILGAAIYFIAFGVRALLGHG